MADTPLNMVPQVHVDPKSQPLMNQPSATDATTAAAAISTNTPNEIAKQSSNTKISSLADLKRKAPKVYNFMMLSIAQNICIQMQRDQDRLKDMWRELRENK
ncbi:MAG: hypothetical protein LLG04_16445 [Parachlamydia sp.]|nr:hypothetical protein [Parachlamydia sp.]